MREREVGKSFHVLVSNVTGWLDTGIVIAATRCGAGGVLNLSGLADAAAAIDAIARVSRLSRAPFAVKLSTGSPLADQLVRELPSEVDRVILTAGDEEHLGTLVATVRDAGRKLLLEVTRGDQAAAAGELGFEGLIAKGHESGGRVGEESTFVLLQRLLDEQPLPVFACGGIGVHSAAAAAAGGAAGVVLDDQLLLLPESSFPRAARRVVERMEVNDTVCLGRELGRPYRVLKRPELTGVEEVDRLERELLSRDTCDDPGDHWLEAVTARLLWTDPVKGIWPVGQAAALAAPFARQFYNVAGVVDALRQSVEDHLEAAGQHPPLRPGSPLAESHSTAFPILQGPMTRVSDTPEFVSAVAQNGALPFLALALLRKREVSSLLNRTKDLLGDRPWGVGILGFVQADLREEQLEVIREVRPPFAIIAGGRPDQAASLEKMGVPTYLHVPTSRLLRLFLKDGARRFIFEGRECGGHVGPTTSFVLWENVVQELLEAVDSGVKPEDLHIVFAGGIHDARSAAMVAALAAPLAAKGVRIGVLMGTAYLLTEEAVSTGAVVEGFQQEALKCKETVLLESGTGHATRCAPSPFCDTFRRVKHDLLMKAESPDQVREVLEKLNIGRLRVASKGIDRVDDGSGPRYVSVSGEEQRQEGMYMIGQVASLLHRKSTMRQLHEDVSSGSSTVLAAMRSSRTPRRSRSREPEPSCDVAIIGMGCLLPKARNVREFWTNVVNKVDAVEEIPRERFDVDRYFGKDRKAGDKIYSRWGAFLDPVPFDPVRFGIPPKTLDSIDPMQLLSLVVVDQALQDAGYDRRPFNRERTATILGLSGGLGDLGIDYAFRASLASHFEKPPVELLERLPEWTEDSFAGILLNVAAGRVANRFNFGGVNFVVDAACASSLSAVYAATRELTAGTSDMVVVGGVDTVQSPFGYLCFSSSQALSPTGSCATFDENADGIVISEGLAVLLLKRLADAERDGDRTYAVIKGIAGSSDGRGKTMTAPRREGQVTAMRRAYEQARIRPSTVSLIEAHGTGTVAGDATELASLSSLFEEDGAAPHVCAIGSVKSMVGHTKSAAGITGLMKAALSLYHQTLPPTNNVKMPNPKLREQDCPFYVSTEPQPWLPPSVDVPRRAGVSAFGFGGTNFHAVLEEYQDDISDPLERPATAEWPAELFLWRASSTVELDASLDQFSTWLNKPAGWELRELAASVCERFSDTTAGGFRLAVVADSMDQLRSRVAAARKALAGGGAVEDARNGVFFASAPETGEVAFLFSGQGSQHPDMLRDMAVHFPEFRQSLAFADRLLADLFPRRFSSYIYPPPSFTPPDKSLQMRELTDTAVAQPALGAVELALYRLLRRLGIVPHMTAGHSYGEYPALFAAGVLSAEALIKLSEARGRIIKESATADGLGTMAAVTAEGSAVAAALNGIKGVVLANYNSPSQTVIAGSHEAIATAAKVLETAGLAVRSIPVSCAFHSELMEPARSRFAQVLADQDFHPPQIPVYSNTLAVPHAEDPRKIADTLADHLVKPVRFTEEIESMYGAGARLFVELGPKGVLAGMVGKILDGREFSVLQLEPRDGNGIVHFLRVLGQLAVRGVPVQPDELFRGRVRHIPEFGRSREQKPEPAFLVNGKRAFHRSSPPQPVEPLPVPAPAEIPAPAAVSDDFRTPVDAAAAAAPAKYSPASSEPLPEHADDVMLQFQRTMEQFLQTQSSIMTAFLGGAPGDPVVSLPSTMSSAAPVQSPVPRESPVPVPPAEPEQREPVTVDPAPGPRDAKAGLLALVGDRTGYPTDMLDLDANIEADLGIDSIKRVEILGAYQQTLDSSAQSAVQGIMDRLTSARTLGEIAELLSSVTASVPVSQPPAGDASPEATPRDFRTDLLRIVSDRTGYPVEMLDLGAGIESDLGIDSIKRVEILGAFQQSLSEAQQAAIQAVMDSLTAATTLGQIAERVHDAFQGSGPATASPAAEAAVPRFRLAAVDEPSAGGGGQYFPGRVSLITDDETGLAAQLADDLRDNGERPILMRHSRSGILAANGVVSADLTNYDSVRQAIEAVRSEHGAVGAVIHLLPLRADRRSINCSHEDWREQVDLDAKTLYAISRAAQSDLERTGRAGGSLLAAITARGGEFGLEPSDSVPPTHHGIADFIKTATTEFSDVLCKIIDVDPTDPLPILRQKLLVELTSMNTTLQVGLPGDRRLTVLPEWAALGDQGTVAMGRDWVVLLTGGARGITAEIAKALAAQRQPTLVLAGRSPLTGEEEPAETAGVEEPARLKSVLAELLKAKNESVKPADVKSAYQKLIRQREIRRNLGELRRSGAKVEYHSVDVCDEASFTSLMEGIYEKWGRLDVVIHGAGIIEDKLISGKTPESFDRVVHTKADAVHILSRALRPESLKCLILMSSITAAFGNRGQADYAVANGVMNGAAVLLSSQWPGRVVAMNWGPWDQRGMASEDVRRQFIARGIVPIPLAGGCAAVIREIESATPGDPLVCVGDGPWAKAALNPVRSSVRTGK